MPTPLLVAQPPVRPEVAASRRSWQRPPRRIVRRATQLLGATYLARAAAAMRSAVNARWLGPELYGFWSALSLLMSFGYYLHGGLQDVLARDVPSFRRQGRPDLAEASINYVLTLWSVMLAAGSLLLCASAWSLPAGTPMIERAGWLVAAIVLPLEVLWSFEQLVARAEKGFARISGGLVVTSLASLALTYALVTRYRLAGLYLVAVLTPGLGLWWLRRGAGVRRRLAWSWPRVGAMARAGWPLLMISLIMGALGWIDQIIVLRLFGTAAFGHYALGAMVAQLCGLFPMVIASVMEPQVFSDFASQRRPLDVRGHLSLQLKTLALVMPLGLSVLDLAAPAIVRAWLPAYLPAVPAMRVLVWGSFFAGVAMCVRSLIVALDRQRRVLPIYGLALAANAAISVTLATQGLGLMGVALGTSAAAAMCSAGLVAAAFRWLGEAPWRVVVRSALHGLPFLALLGLSAGPSSLRALMPESARSHAAILHGAGLSGYAVVVGVLCWRWARPRVPRAGRHNDRAPARIPA